MGLLYKFPKLYTYLANTIAGYSTHTDQKYQLALIQIDNLPSQSWIMDLACGTGELTLLLAEQRPDCHLFGVDSSADMLTGAAKKAQAKGLTNVSFIAKPVLNLVASDFSPTNGTTHKPLDMIVGWYGFSAMSDYEATFQHTLSLLAQGGTYVIIDVYYPERTWLNRFITNAIDTPLFGANLFRKPFLAMQKELAEFQMQETLMKDWGISPASYYIARGTKQ